MDSRGIFKSQEQTKPIGIRFIEQIRKSTLSFGIYQALVIILTFFAYASYHASRKCLSIVKSTLDPTSTHLAIFSWHSVQSLRLIDQDKQKHVSSTGWPPFNGSDGTELLGILDVAFLSLYAICMYIAGQLGDRLNLRIFLATGMVGTGLFTALFGAGYWLNIHSFCYFLLIQIIAGVFQSTGWPSVVAVVGNWFGKRRRGLIMGIWNAHTSIGNISGSLIASVMLKYGWGWSFAVPGLLIAFMSLLVYLFLPVSPDAVGLGSNELLESPKTVDSCEPLLKKGNGCKEQAVGFIEAWKIPEVANYAFCLFFSKLVLYTFLYWLPFYISHTEIGGKYLSDETAGNLSTIFDVGGVLGGILAGHISDWLDGRAITSAMFIYCAIPFLFLYRAYGSISLYLNMLLMFIIGMFTNGPYALITTAVSADLGTHGSSHALATVAAIIDGTGSIGAALGPLLTGFISAKCWNGVFVMLMVAALLAGLLLTKRVIHEVAVKFESSEEERRLTQVSV